MVEENVSFKDAKTLTLKAFLTYASRATHKANQTRDEIKQKLFRQIDDVVKKHQRHLEKMKQGVFYKNIERDPRESKQVDNVEYENE